MGLMPGRNTLPQKEQPFRARASEIFLPGWSLWRAGGTSWTLEAARAISALQGLRGVSARRWSGSPTHLGKLIVVLVVIDHALVCHLDRQQFLKHDKFAALGALARGEMVDLFAVCQRGACRLRKFALLCHADNAPLDECIARECLENC